MAANLQYEGAPRGRFGPRGLDLCLPQRLAGEQERRPVEGLNTGTERPRHGIGKHDAWTIVADPGANAPVVEVREAEVLIERFVPGEGVNLGDPGFCRVEPGHPGFVRHPAVAQRLGQAPQYVGVRRTLNQRPVDGRYGPRRVIRDEPLGASRPTRLS